MTKQKDLENFLRIMELRLIIVSIVIALILALTTTDLFGLSVARENKDLILQILWPFGAFLFFCSCVLIQPKLMLAGKNFKAFSNVQDITFVWSVILPSVYPEFFAASPENAVLIASTVNLLLSVTVLVVLSKPLLWVKINNRQRARRRASQDKKSKRND